MCTDPDGCGNHGADPDAHVLGRRVVLGGLAGSALALGTGEMAVGAPGVGRRPGGQDRRRAKLELVLLGTRAGPPIDPYRMGISTALVVDGSTYLVDCGRGSVTQYVRAGLRLSALRSIFITHLHADHVADYYNYFLLAGSSPNSRGDAMPDHISVYGPGAAGGLPPTFGGGEAPTVSPARPTPGLVDLTNSCHDAHAYSHNVFLRDTGVRDARDLADVHEIDLPDIGADYENTAPEMEPFVVMEDNKVRVSAILVPHGPVFPSFAYRFDTRHGSVTFSGDTTYTPAGEGHRCPRARSDQFGGCHRPSTRLHQPPDRVTRGGAEGRHDRGCRSSPAPRAQPHRGRRAQPAEPAAVGPMGAARLSRACDRGR